MTTVEGRSRSSHRTSFVLPAVPRVPPLRVMGLLRFPPRTSVPPLTAIEPTPWAAALASRTAPLLTVKPPPYAFAPLSVSVPVPICRTSPAPAIALSTSTDRFD